MKPCLGEKKVIIQLIQKKSKLFIYLINLFIFSGFIKGANINQSLGGNRNRFNSENFQIKTLDESSSKTEINIDPKSVKYNLEGKNCL